MAQIKMLPRSTGNRTIIFAAIFVLSGISSACSHQNTETLKKSATYETIQVKVVKTIPLPKGWHEGLCLNERYLWVINGEGGKIWAVDKESGEVSSTITPVAGFTESVSKTPDGRFLIPDWDEKRLYKASLDKERLVPESWVSVSPSHPAGAVWTGDRLFMITWMRGMGTKFDLLELGEKMNLLSAVSIQAIEEPAQLAWDGEYLWISSWYDQLVYKVDTKRWEILGSFRSPVSKATGIAWDGKYLWLTGTYSDLYKMEIIR